MAPFATTAMKRFALSLVLVSPFGPLLADGPADNNPTTVRRVPPLGIEVEAADRKVLMDGLTKLEEAIANARGTKTDLLPDVEIFSKAVFMSLTNQEFQKPQELQMAKELLEMGMERAVLLLEGKAPWLTQSGLVVRGFRSKIDRSVQPYGLVIPESYNPRGAVKHRLDFWFHGRNERKVELGFIHERTHNLGQYQPKDTIVLHPFARYSNGNKFAGEIDCLEALEHAKKHYRIDPDRILVRGFSMGGAACWNFAVHYSDRWCAANPGAGYSETPDFLRTFQGETLKPTWYQKKLWHMHDCPDWALNLVHLPTVAYSGEIDRPKQAADIMAVAMRKEDLTLRHIIGPKMGHKIDAGSKREIERRLDEIAARGRDTMPHKLRFTTWTLRYNRMHWLTVDRMAEHWNQARVEAEILDGNVLKIEHIENVTAFTIDMPAGSCPFEVNKPIALAFDGTMEEAPPVYSDRSWKLHCRLENGKWIITEHPPADRGLVKRHGLQGPIDDAFLDSFLFVTPTGDAWHEKTGNWVASELDHASEQWRRQFRGEARITSDTSVSADAIRDHNLVLWGDPQSNKVLARIIDKLPLTWTREKLTVGSKSFASEHHAPILIFPNPLNPERYVVLNSGFTYREYDYLNNARQVSKLPDWAIVDVNSPPTSQVPGAIPEAGFFNEQWQLGK